MHANSTNRITHGVQIPTWYGSNSLEDGQAAEEKKITQC